MARHILILALFFLGKVSSAIEVPPKPEGATRYINDYANILSPDEENFLNQKLQKYWDSTSSDLVVVTLPTLNGEDPFSAGLKIYNAWGLGTAAKDNGVLILIALENEDPSKRKIAITTGKGAEGFLPDGASGEIIRDFMGPAFRSKLYGKGINDALDQIILRSKGEYKNTEKPPGKFPVWLIIIIIIFVISFISSNSDPGSKNFGGKGISGSPMWWGGFGGGGSGSGGFGGGGGGWSGGFGGGMSGGGGASGSW